LLFAAAAAADEKGDAGYDDIEPPLLLLRRALCTFSSFFLFGFSFSSFFFPMAGGTHGLVASTTQLPRTKLIGAHLIEIRGGKSVSPSYCRIGSAE
jgi:hypothetical protein